MAIIINLDKLLASKKMQSNELARELDVTIQTVSRLKNGKVRALRIETLNQICELFHCQPGDVLEYVTDEELIERYGKDYYEEYHAYFDE